MEVQSEEKVDDSKVAIQTKEEENLEPKKDDKEKTSGSVVNEDDERENADDDGDEISSGSVEDLDKRKQVKPEEEEDFVSWKCERNGCSACVDPPFFDEKCIEAMAIKKDTGIIIRLSYLSDGKLKKSWEKKINDPIDFTYKGVGITFYDISLTREKFGGCAKLKFAGFYEKNLKCFHTKFRDEAPQADDYVPIRIRHGRWLPGKPKTSKQSM
ncbi:uncharacterized protein LOC110238477 [Exaiptasia diaphana]|uniref:Uncharacterized protein n=1 Tax=Exaiptasia diaphana TaxID=2652724 RepID=A0A913X6Y6_EXADI|nr:uncharacterized protein LOC110238477 [Exaiptasia diaphana]